MSDGSHQSQARVSGADQKRFAVERDAVGKEIFRIQLAEAQRRAREWMEAFRIESPVELGTLDTE
jgi:hypothetical protein